MIVPLVLTAHQSVTRLYQLSHANDIRVFPQFAGSQANRKVTAHLLFPSCD
jgi:hypothetical protein